MDNGTVDFISAFKAGDGLAVLGLFLEDGAEHSAKSTEWFDVGMKMTPFVTFRLFFLIFLR